MTISTQTRYAIRFLVELDYCSESGAPTTLQHIAERQGLSSNYLESIATKLKKHGYLNSYKGSGGGYSLIRDMDEITLGEIMRLMETTYFQIHCTRDAEKTCRHYGSCRIAPVWGQLESHLDSFVDNVRLSQFTGKTL